MNEWKIGDVTIKRIVETEGAWRGTWILPAATAENVKKEADWLYPVFSNETGQLRMSVHAFVVESDGKRIIVDTCIGNDKVRSNPAWNKLQLPFLSDLAKTGHQPEQIDRVLCTHLHVDHVGWNTTMKNGKWMPTFPNARYLFGGTEWDYWSHFDGADMRDPVEDSVRPIVDQGLADLVDPNHRVTSEVWYEPTPGHTPGHMSVRISSKGQEAVITGDLMHHPIQCQYPEWDDGFDSDGAMAKKTRRAFCEKYADSGVLVFGTHFATPSAGKISKHGDAFRFAAAK
ncbi:MAG TPA: MBL fold metallo-hydrolase [Candidatus Binataceae bacterium]|nr:MBL fold metallo-hydrolase [Candidatus Binataceae bacterium]